MKTFPVYKFFCIGPDRYGENFIVPVQVGTASGVDAVDALAQAKAAGHVAPVLGEAQNG